jgi:stage V sporulation protein G
MEITEININIRDEEKLKAFVNITFDDVFVVRGLKVIQGNTGLFVCMPSRKMQDGSYKDIAHPINNDFRQKMESMILNEYQHQLKSGAVPGEVEN